MTSLCATVKLEPLDPWISLLATSSSSSASSASLHTGPVASVASSQVALPHVNRVIPGKAYNENAPASLPLATVTIDSTENDSSELLSPSSPEIDCPSSQFNNWRHRHQQLEQRLGQPRHHKQQQQQHQHQHQQQQRPQEQQQQFYENVKTDIDDIGNENMNCTNNNMVI